MTGSPKNVHMVGGLTISSLAEIKQSYSFGSIDVSESQRSGMTNPGGIYFSAGTQSCTSTLTFFDRDRSGVASAYCGTAFNTAQMKSLSTYNGFDFQNVWQYELVDGSSDELKSYPTLRWGR